MNNEWSATSATTHEVLPRFEGMRATRTGRLPVGTDFGLGCTEISSRGPWGEKRFWIE